MSKWGCWCYGRQKTKTGGVLSVLRFIRFWNDKVRAKEKTYMLKTLSPKQRERTKSDRGCLQRIKCDTGIKDRDDKSKKSSWLKFWSNQPHRPLILVYQTTHMKRNWSDSSGISLVRNESSWWSCRYNKRLKSSYNWSVVSTTDGKKTMGSGRLIYNCR